MKKRIKYYIPIEILLVYNIIYIPLLNLLKNNIFNEYAFPHIETMKYMNVITVIIVIISIVSKLILEKKVRAINENERIVSVVLLIGLLIGLIFFTILNMVG